MLPVLKKERFKGSIFLPRRKEISNLKLIIRIAGWKKCLWEVPCSLNSICLSGSEITTVCLQMAVTVSKPSLQVKCLPPPASLLNCFKSQVSLPIWRQRKNMWGFTSLSDAKGKQRNCLKHEASPTEASRVKYTEWLKTADNTKGWQE